jgi:integrase
MPAPRLQAADGEDDPEHPQHPVRRLLHSGTLGVDLLEPAESAKPPTVTRRSVPATSPGDVAKVIAEGRKTHPAMALYLWLVAITGARRGELCALQVRDVDLDNGVLHIAYNYVMVDGRRVRKDTKTHQDRYLAIDPVTCAMLREHLEAIRAELGGLGLELPEDAYVSPTIRWAPARGIPTGPPTRPAT